jgi:hypothetical protein
MKYLDVLVVQHLISSRRRARCHRALARSVKRGRGGRSHALDLEPDLSGCRLQDLRKRPGGALYNTQILNDSRAGQHLV